MKYLKILFIALPFLIASCATKTPDCSDKKTQQLVLEIVKKQVDDYLESYIGKLTLKVGYAQLIALSKTKLVNSERYSEIKYSLDNIAVSSKDEKVDKYVCKATVISSFDKNKIETDIEYSSELVNNGEKHLAVVKNIPSGDFVAMLSVVLLDK